MIENGLNLDSSFSKFRYIPIFFVAVVCLFKTGLVLAEDGVAATTFDLVLFQVEESSQDTNIYSNDYELVIPEIEDFPGDPGIVILPEELGVGACPSLTSD